MAYYNGKKVMAVVDYKPAILIEKEITKNGEYNASDDNADGYSKVIVGGAKPEGNPLQYVIDNNGGDGVPSCKYLFYYYNGTSLGKAIEGLDTSEVTNFSYMFYYCYELTSVPQLDTSNGTNFTYMFCTCSELTSVPALDTSNGTNFSYMFYYCNKLTSIGIYGFTRSIDITPTALEHDAIVAFLNQAGTSYNSNQKITMGSTKLALLSDEEKAIATNKGWTLA